MKKILRGSIYLGILLTIFSGCARREVQDINGLKWGATRAKVIEAEGKPNATEANVYIYSRNLGGIPVQLGYMFVQEKLSAATYFPDIVKINDTSALHKAFISVTDSLNKTFGPSQDEVLENGEKLKKSWHSHGTNVYMYSYLKSFMLTFNKRGAEEKIQNSLPASEE